MTDQTFLFQTAEKQTIAEAMEEHGHPLPGYTAGIESGGYDLRGGVLSFRVNGETIRLRMGKARKWEAA
jgi:hypothetical protein